MADTFTTKLALRQYDASLFYDVSKFSADNVLIDNAMGSVICTSTTRPSTGLFNGMTLWETDTRRYVVRVAGAWVVVPQIAIIADATARAAITTPYDGMMIWRQDMDWMEVYDGAAWRVQGQVTTAALANITNPITGQTAILSTDSMEYRWTGSAWLGVQHTAVNGGHARYRRTTAQTGAFAAASWVRQAFTTAVDTSADVTANGSFDQFTLNRTGLWEIDSWSRANITNVDPMRYLYGVFPGATPGTNTHKTVTVNEPVAISSSTNLSVFCRKRFTAGDVICIAANRLGNSGGGGGNTAASEGSATEDWIGIDLRWVGP